MTLDSRERQFLAQFPGVAVVRLDVDRALEEERFASRRATFRAFQICSTDSFRTFELRAGVVKAAARRVERSESLDDAEHRSILIM